jgi:predicted ATP-grasp superfamily ATP-dependent carboligase
LAAFVRRLGFQASSVFVTDASYHNALAAVRALGQDGFQVTAAEKDDVRSASVLSFWSRYCGRRLRYPDPSFGEERAVQALASHFELHEYTAALPIGLAMTGLFVHHRERLRVPSLLPSRASFDVAADKKQTFALAAELGVPSPRTLPAARWSEIEPPIVFKHRRSGAVVAGTLEQAAAAWELIAAVSDEYLAQEYVPGENGYGYFGFYRDGRERAYFMHSRMLQFPREGGPSVVARSIYDERLRELGRTLLDALGWEGVAMVEFKRSERDGEYYLMEINPKFWGSLDLAIASGCRFPTWIVDALAGGPAPTPGAYRTGVIYQCTVPIGVRTFVRYPEFRRTFLRNLASRSVKSDLQWRDPLPFAVGLCTATASALRR